MDNYTPAPQRLAYTRKEAKAVLGIGLSKLDQLISGGQLRTVRVGRRVLVPQAAIEQFLAA